MIDKLGDFTIEKKIAEGGMGAVYLALQESLQRKVAVKVLNDRYAHDEDFIERFKREARSAAALVHPNIIQIHYVGEDSGINYFAMEFVDGHNLKQHLHSKVRLSVAEALDIIIKTADALKCAAAHDIIHRDIKPENIMVTPEGRVKVTDFGLAKCMTTTGTDLTQVGKVLGTVNYMSPEQGMGGVIDTRSDIYSLGTVFFEILAGRPPFMGDHPTSIVYMHVYEPPPPVRYYNKAVPVELEYLILEMMAKPPGDRPQDPGELISKLELVREQCGLLPEHRRSKSDSRIATIKMNAAPEKKPIRKKCLIIEDDTDVSYFCASVLKKRFDIDILIAEDGIRGLEIWRKESPDLVLLDLMMPNLGGMAVLEEKRAEKLSGKVLVASAVNDWETIQRTAVLDVAGYVLKPYTVDDIVRKVSELLGETPLPKK